MKPGFKTTEFWLTAVAVIIGLVLIAVGREDVGKTIIGFVVPGYAVSRGVAKKL